MTVAWEPSPWRWRRTGYGEPMPVTLLGAGEIRALAAELDVTPTKKLGQNFVVDANSVRKIVAEASRNDFRFSSLISGVVRSTPFQMRNSQ